MNALSSNIVELLTFLLPGFVSAAVFYSLTPFPRREPFERTVQALIFTILIQAVVVVVRACLIFIGQRVVAVGNWSTSVELVWSVAVALLLGLSAAYVSNTDSLHSFLRSVGVTHQTSFASEWYGAFSRGDSYAILHLQGARRLYGWPEEWPSTPGKGHFVIVQAEWVEESERIPLAFDTRVLVSASDVEMVELIPAQTSMANKETKENGRSKSAVTTSATKA